MPKTPELELPVRAYYSPERLAAGDPDWLGTLDAFWHEHRDYTVGQILDIADKLKSRGSAIFRAEDGSPDFWLVRGGADQSHAPKGWDVAETSTEETDAEKSPAGRTNTSYLIERAELAERLNGKLLASNAELLHALSALAATAENVDGDFAGYRQPLRFSVQQARAAIAHAKRADVRR